VIFLLIFLPLVLAVPLLIRGRRRRVGSEPHCRKCDYLLHGIESERCPECGSALSPKTIVHGERRRRVPSFIGGWLLLLLGLAIVIAAATVQVQQIDWYEYEPTHFVLKDLASQNNATVIKAWHELTRRDALGSLSAGVRDKLVQFAIAQQGKAAAPYSPLDTDTINYLGSRITAGDLPKDQQTKVFEQSVQTNLLIRPRVLQGDSIPYLFAHQGLGPTNGSYWSTLSERGGAIDGRIEPNENIGASGSDSGFGSGSFGSSLSPLPPGKHQIALNFRIQIFRGTMNVGPSTLLYQADRTLTGSVEIVTKEIGLPIQPLFDPKVAASVNAAISPGSFTYSSKNKFLDGEIRINNAPVNLAFDVFARYDGAEHPLNAVTYRANSGLWQFGVNSQPPLPPPKTIDLILRPSEAAARNTVDLQNYWNRELVFPAVPVTRN
jgi:hypothetical protein